MGAVKRKLEMIEDFAARLPNGLLTAAELSCYVVSSVVGDEVREYCVDVACCDGYWYARYGTPENPEMFELDFGYFSGDAPEHQACVEALFAIPGIIIEID